MRADNHSTIDVTDDTDNQVELNNSGFITAATHNQEADADKDSNLLIRAANIALMDGSTITAATTGRGQGGDILLIADQIRLSGQNTRVSSSAHGPGDAGLVRIQGGNLTLTTGARIESTSGFAHPLEQPLHLPRTGSAGHLVIQTGERIQLYDGSSLTTASENAGGGGIQVETRDLLHLQDSRITTSVKGGDGRGGDIAIDPVFVILENSRIQANAHGGAGGNINLVADYLLHSGPSVIEASSKLSTSGRIDVQAVVVDAGSLHAIPQIDALNVAQWVQAPCHLSQSRSSSLVMTGYDAHPTAVDDVLSTLPLYATPHLQPSRPQTPRARPDNDLE